MKNIQVHALAAIAIVSVVAAKAAELPPRETIAKDGWVLEFSPVDRPTAEKLAGRVGQLEQARQAAAVLNLELNPAALEARSPELAQRMTELCALPARRADFQEELKHMAAGLAPLEAELAQAAFPRSVAIWRKPELIQRLAAGEKIAGYSYDATANTVNFDYKPHWTVDKDYAVTEHPEAIGALPLKKTEEVAATDDSIAAMEKDFQSWCKGMGAMLALGMRYQVFGSLENVVRKVLEAQLPRDPSVKWISVGAARWAARNVMVQITSPRVADRYTILYDRALQGVKPDAGPVDLEAWPAGQETQHYAAAVQVFRNIAEKQGDAAIPRLLGEFWRRPPGQRTSPGFRQLYQRLFRERLEAEAPAGVRFGAG
jgi:hypothetical protein